MISYQTVVHTGSRFPLHFLYIVFLNYINLIKLAIILFLVNCVDIKRTWAYKLAGMVEQKGGYNFSIKGKKIPALQTTCTILHC